MWLHRLVDFRATWCLLKLDAGSKTWVLNLWKKLTLLLDGKLPKEAKQLPSGVRYLINHAKGFTFYCLFTNCLNPWTLQVMKKISTFSGGGCKFLPFPWRVLIILQKGYMAHAWYITCSDYLLIHIYLSLLIQALMFLYSHWSKNSTGCTS